MKKKNIFFILSMFQAIFLVGMDLPKTPDVTSADSNSDSVTVDLPKPSSIKTDSVPSLNLLNVGRVSSRRLVGMTQRKPISKQADVSDLARARSVYRGQEQQESARRTARKVIDSSHRTGSAGSSLRNRGGQVVRNPHSDSPQSQSTVKINDLMQEIGENYDENDMWDLLEIVNPVLHDFAINRGLSLHQAKEFARALRDYEIKPTALIQHLKNISGFKSNTVDQFEKDEYKNIQAKDSRKYKMLILDLIDQLWTAQDNAEVNAPGSLIQNTHLGIQADQIESQKSDIFYRTIGLICSFIIATGTSAWGIYGQATGGTNHTG